MEADFSGYATKAGLKCSDGRTIMPGAFQHQDQQVVPLVWQHGHNDPTNVLGKAILEHRADGVYAYAFFNDTAKAEHAKSLVKHKNITKLSIWANDLVERAGRVMHGAIREVSLVMAGANPGAVIENVNIAHSDGGQSVLDDEAIIHTGLDIDSETVYEIYEIKDDDDELEHDDFDDDEDDFDDDAEDDTLAHEDKDDQETVADILSTFNKKQKQVLYYMLGEAVSAGSSAKHDDMSEDDNGAADSDSLTHNDQKGSNMTGTRNVFEDGEQSNTLSHDALMTIVLNAKKNGSLAEAAEQYALAHGIDNIGALFPDAQALDSKPEFLKRRTEWVASFLGGTRKSPFSRIRTLAADLTMEEARAKGYVTGNMKKEEFFGVTTRVTIPTTVYKKQKLDRDDMVDITDFDVVVWLKAEMRIMLDEEIARAALIGDGRDVSHDDKINEGNIRPISKDHSLFTTTVNVPDNASAQGVIDDIIRNRKYLKGTGMPTFYTTETWISNFLLLKDSVGRRIYRNLEELASELRVRAIVPVEVMEEEPDIVGIMVNPADYVMGATAGGEVTMFDDFDIDYNQYKYLIETRMCGALVKLKSAIVVKLVDNTDTVVTPAAPTLDRAAGDHGQVTIVDTTGVVYTDQDGNTLTAGNSPHDLVEGENFTVIASAAENYYITNGADVEWTFFGRS